MRGRTRLAAAAASLLLLAVLSTRCARDLAPGRGEGGLDLRWVSPAGLPASGSADSLRLWVFDSAGRTLVGPVVAPLAEGAAIDLAVRVPAGDDRSVRLQLESGDAGAPQLRGTIAAGGATGIRIQPGSANEVSIPLHPTVPVLEPIEAEPGQPSYSVRWSRVEGAQDYELQESRASGTVTWIQPDTFRAVDLHAMSGYSGLAPGKKDGAGPDPVKGAFRKAQVTLLPDSTFYRVRSRSGQGGASLYSARRGVPTSELLDLPQVLSVLPPEGTSGVPDSSQIEIRFSQAMDPSSATDTTITFEDEEPGAGQPARFTIWEEGNGAVRLIPLQPLRRGASYLLRLRPTLRSSSGWPLDQDPGRVGLQGFESRFTTELYNPLRVLSVSPADGDTAVDVLPTLLVRLNRAARPNTVSFQTVQLVDSLGPAVTNLNISLSPDSVIRITPLDSLHYASHYRIQVSSGVRDLRGRQGEPLDQDPSTPQPESFLSRFRTKRRPPPPPQPVGPLVAWVVPADEAESAAVFRPVWVHFSRPVQTASVERDNNLSVRRLPVGASLPGRIEHSADRTTFAFYPTNNNGLFERDQRYRVVVTRGVLDDAGIPFDQDSTVAGYQEFSSSFRAENNPQVVSCLPRDGQTRVATDTVVVVRLSLPVLPATVHETSLSLEAGGTPVPLLPPEFSPDTLTVTLRPQSPLDHFTTYTVRADTTILTSRGSRFDQVLGVAGYQIFLSRFTTRAESLPPQVIDADPRDGETGVPVDREIRVRFNKPILERTVDESTFYLRRLPAGSDVPARREVAADSLSAVLIPLSPLDYLTDYQVTVTYWVTDRFDVHLDQDPDSASYQDYVAVFQTTQERTPPRVIQVSPLFGADSVAVSDSVVVSFSEPMATAGTLEDALSLRTGPEAVAGSLRLSPDGLRLSFVPGQPLRYDLRYDLQVDTTATDRAGNHLDQEPSTGVPDPFASFFRTTPDLRGPRVASALPAAGDTAVEVTVLPALTFDEAVLPSSLTRTSVRLLDSLDVAVPLADLQIGGDGRSVTLVPAESLAFHTSYSLEATPDVQDTSGNALDQDPALPGSQSYRGSFRTRAENIPPHVLGVSYDGGPPVPISSRLRIAFSEPVDAASLNLNSVRLLLEGVAQPLTLSRPAPDTVLVVPAALLQYDRTYLLRVEGVRDLHGNPLDQDRSTPAPDPSETFFVTAPDLEGPQVTVVSPDSGATGVSPAVVIQVTFSEAMQAGSVIPGELGLYRIDQGVQLVPGTITASVDLRRFTYHPDAPLAEGGHYMVRASINLTDLAGNPLDQDPAVPGPEEFFSHFLVGIRPVAQASPGICDPPDSSFVTMDGSLSSDPDGQILQAAWDWGDGHRDTLDAPAGLTASHSYACTDSRGCDGLDNDADGAADESGPGGCDESYRIVLSVQDDDGLWSSDTTGVSFCAFRVLSTDPPEDAVVDSALVSARIRLSRPLLPAGVNGTLFRLEEEGVGPVGVTLSLSPNGLEVVLTPADTLRGGTLYHLRATVDVRDQGGLWLDQDPCQPGRQPFESTFTTIPAPAVFQPPDRPRRLTER